MEKQHPIGDLMTTTMQKLREIADVNTIVGKPILAGEDHHHSHLQADGGLRLRRQRLYLQEPEAGGRQLLRRRQRRGNEPVPGGLPDCQGDSVRLMPVAPPPGTAVDRVVEMVPDVIDKVTGFIEKQQDKDKSQG